MSLDVESGTTIFHKLRALWQRISRLRKLKKDLRIDVSISFLEGADYINILSRSGDKVVLSIRGSKRFDETMRNRMPWLRTRILIPWLYRKADVLVAVNYGIASELQKYGLQKSRIVTIGNFYDLEKITRLSVEPKEVTVEQLYQDPIVITTGRLAPEKGLTSLIHVFYGLRRSSHNLRLMVIGDGPQKEELIRTCRHLNLEVHAGPDFDKRPDVLLLGSQTNVFKYLKGATMYLMNSSSEGFPNGMAEAMICHVPVVSSDCPYGPREILAPEFPFVVPVLEPYIASTGIIMPMIKSEGDIQTWIKTLSGLLEKKELLLQLAEKGRDRISHFDQSLVVSEWHRVLNNEI